MNTFAINEALRPPRIGSLAMISGTLLCAAGAVGPALSADLPYEDMPYRSGYRSDYSYDTGFNTGCYRCSCCGRRIVRVAEPPEVEERPPLEVVERPIVERFPVAERHWVQRDYIERRYYETRYPYSAYPRRDHYSYYYPGRGADYDAVPPGGPGRERRFGYGAEYPPPYRYVTSSRAYDYRPAYEYRPSYEYEVPRPPAPVPSGYYGPGYSE